MKPAIVTFGGNGAELAAKLAGIVDGEVIACGSDAADAKAVLPPLFRDGRPIIGICAAGILIRLLAPHLSDKQKDPPVLAVSQDGAHVVPLLGGHHGANRLARQIAEAIGASAVVTTASDSKYGRGLDEPPAGWVLANPGAAKAAMQSLMLVGGKLRVEGYAPWIEEAGYPVSFSGAVRVRVGETTDIRERELLFHPRTLVVGVGAERGVETQEVIALIETTLADEKLAHASLAALATVDLKADETALHEAAQHFGVPLRIFSVAELNQERYRLVNPSDVVEAEIGTPSVAEAAAWKAGSLLVPKRKSQHATCAIGKAAQPLDVNTIGHGQGMLHVVGIGPGDKQSRTASAVAALDRSSDWVG